MKPMFSILMPYWRRAEQLHNTLVSFVRQYWGKHDLYEVVLIEDGKNWQNPDEHEKLMSLINEFSKEIIFRYVRSHHDGWNPAPLYNLGAQVSRGQFLVITNPECFHTKNILAGLSEEFHLGKDNYIVCGTQSWKECTNGIKIVMRDDLVVVHQEHEKVRPPGYSVLIKRNRALWLNERPGRLERAKAGRFFE